MAFFLACWLFPLRFLFCVALFVAFFCSLVIGSFIIFFFVIIYYKYYIFFKREIRAPAEVPQLTFAVHHRLLEILLQPQTTVLPQSPAQYDVLDSMIQLRLLFFFFKYV